MTNLFRRIAEKRRAQSDTIALIELVNKTSMQMADGRNDTLVSDLFKCAAEGAAPSVRITWNADGTLSVEHYLGATEYGETQVLADGHSTPLARILFLAFVSAWSEAAVAFARSPKLGP